MRQQLVDSGKEVVALTEAQIHQFAGNMLQLKGEGGQSYLVMSSAAYNSLTAHQVNTLEKYTQIVYAPLDTIETLGGGSARCMLAEVFLPSAT